MQCPRCKTALPDGVASCPRCGASTMALPASLTDELWQDDDTPADPPQRAPSLLTSAPSTAELRLAAAAPPPPVPPPAPRATAGEPRAAMDPPTRESVQGNIATQVIQTDQETNRPTRVVQLPVPPVVRRAQQAARATTAAPDSGEATDLLEGVGQGARQLYARLNRVDRLALWTCLATLVAACLPWRRVLGVGMSAGVESLGAASAGGAALAALCIYGRAVRRRLAALPHLGQLGASTLALAAPVYLLVQAPWNELMLGTYLTTLTAAVLALLSLLRLAVRG